MALCGFRLPATGDLPTAVLRKAGIAGSPGGPRVACLDPVSLQADIGSARLFDASRFELLSGEAESFVQEFNGHFSDRGLTLEADLANAWHVRLPAEQAVSARSIREVRGKDVMRLLPAGSSAAFWLGVMNEAQMLFHDLPLNRKREAAGQMSVNGVWFHGAGSDPEFKTMPWSGLWGDDPLLKGIGLKTGIPVNGCPADIDAFLAQAGPGAHLVVLDDLSAPADYDEYLNWVEALRGLEERWFAPLSKRREVTHWVIQDDTGRSFERKRGLRWPWRTHPRLGSYARDKGRGET